MRVILDKSYLDGVKKNNVLQLCDNHTAMMIDSLFYELMTTSNISRARCFSKLPKKVNPLILIPNAGQYYRHEMENKKPFEKIELLKENITFKFNEGLSDENFECHPDVEELFKRDENETKEDARKFVERSLTVCDFFGAGNNIKSLIKRVAVEDSLVREIYNMIIPDGDKYFEDRLDPEQLDGRWVMFRWIQTQIIYGLMFSERYNCKIPEDPGEKFWINAEHEMHDADYVLFGVMTGAIATRDKRIEKTFRLLCPNGRVF